MNFTVYKITNNINNKSYIGSSINVEKRWQQEKNDAYNSNKISYFYPLQQAFRKYGIENFIFEIIKNNFSTLEEMWQYEQDMIIFYNTLSPNGYNQTLFTKCALQDSNVIKKLNQKRAQKCALVDNEENIIEIYVSYQEAGRQNGYENSANHIRQVCLGKRSSFYGKLFRKLDENNNIIHQELLPYKNRKRIIAFDPSINQQHIYFESILSAANTLQLDRCSIQKCLRGDSRYSIVGGYIFRYIDDNNDIIPNKIDLTEKLDEYNSMNPIINNEQHSITDWCKIYNITRQTFYNRKKQGMDTITAITSPKRR